MDKKEYKLQDTPIEDGYACNDCKRIGFCKQFSRRLKPENKYCEYSPSMFTLNDRQIKHDCFWFNEEYMMEGLIFYCGNTESKCFNKEIRCGGCKLYLPMSKVNQIIKENIEEES